FYINETLSIKVWRRVALEYNNGSAVNYNPTAFLEYLNRIYSDAGAADRARIELDSIKQEAKERFEDYRMRFEDQIIKAECIVQPAYYTSDTSHLFLLQQRLAQTD
ncbi:hypothetical protein E4U59_006635, partial [Claviceps monticola]